MKFRTPFNQKAMPKFKVVKVYPPGKTLPEQSLTIRQILDRWKHGLPLSVNMNQPVYHGDQVEVPDFAKLDLAEIEAYRQRLDQRIGELKGQYKKEYDQALKDKAEKRRKQEEAWIERNKAKLQVLLKQRDVDIEKPQ